MSRSRKLASRRASARMAPSRSAIRHKLASARSGIGGRPQGGEQALVLGGNAARADAELGEHPLGPGHVGQAHARQPARQGGTNAAHK